MGLSTTTFKKAFINILKESMTSAAVTTAAVPSIYNPAEGQINSGDFYAPGDLRIPKGSHPITTRNGKLKKRKRKKRSRTLAAKKPK